MKTWMATTTFAAALLLPHVVWAGEVKFGAQPLETDDDGKLTSAGRSAATTDIPSEPGEELWILNIWAQVDKGAPGPLYADFIGKLPDGKSYTAYRHEHAEYAGDKFVSFPIELEGNSGFNKGASYTVNLKQISSKGKDIILGSGTITLVYTEAQPEDASDGGDALDSEQAAQDEFDSLAGGDAPDGDGPPPVDAKGKKGCSVATEAGLAPGWLVLLGLGAAARRRRRNRPSR